MKTISEIVGGAIVGAGLGLIAGALIVRWARHAA